MLASGAWAQQNNGMPCLVALFALITPRIVLILVWLFSHLLDVYTSWIWPVLGFFFMPLTTLAYAWAMKTQGSVSGFPFFVVLVAALIDLGSLGGGRRASRRRRRR